MKTNFILISLTFLLSILSGCVKEKLHTFSGYVFYDCENRVPFANKEIAIVRRGPHKEYGRSTTDENGFFSITFNLAGMTNASLKLANSSKILALNLGIKEPLNHGGEFFLSATYNIKVYLDVVNQYPSNDFLVYGNKTKNSGYGDTLFGPFQSKLLYSGKASVVEPSYPISRDYINYSLNDDNTKRFAAHYDIQTLCVDTTVVTIRLE